MAGLSKFWLLLLAAASAWIAFPGVAASAGVGDRGRLVSVDWLRQNLARPDLVLVDASPASRHRQQHLPGAIPSDLMTFGPRDTPIEQVQTRLRAWGVNAGQQLVLYDQGGTYMAARLFWDLVHRGFPAENLSILDGGMAMWLAAGGQTTKDTTALPRPGTVSLTTVNPDVRVLLPEFLAATADPVHHVMLDAMGPSYFFGGAAIFNRAGHVPHATLMPMEDFFEADKTFKSPQEIRRMLDHLGVRPEQQVLTYCGGGGAAAVPFFALKYLLDYPRVRMFQESQLAGCWTTASCRSGPMLHPTWSATRLGSRPGAARCSRPSGCPRPASSTCAQPRPSGSATCRWR